MECGGLVQRICNMDEQRIIRVNLNRGWPDKGLKQHGIERKLFVRPGVVDPGDSTWEEAIWVDVLHVGDVPPYFVDTSKNGDDQSS